MPPATHNVEVELLLCEATGENTRANAEQDRRQWRARIGAVAVVSVCLVVAVIMQRTFSVPAKNSASLEDVTALATKSREGATVIFVNAKYGFKDNSIAEGGGGIEEGALNCSTPCYVTYDSKYSKSADVVIQDLVAPADPITTEKPEKQKWIFNFYYEAFPRFIMNYMQVACFAKLMDWTMTYKIDSDFHDPMMKMVPIQKPHTCKRDYSKGRKYLLLWYVSNCRQDRLDFVHRLKKLLPDDSVHIYGACGDPSPCKGRNESDACYTELFSKYKFYGAFENVGCSGYVTEKFYRGLMRGMVPLVFGGLSKQDYVDQGVPADAFLSVDEFGSMQELADRLRTMPDDEYNGFYAWRSKYEVQSRTTVATNNLCNVCQAVGDKAKDAPKESSKDLMRWWYDDTCRGYAKDLTGPWELDKTSIYPVEDKWEPSDWKTIQYKQIAPMPKLNFHLR